MAVPKRVEDRICREVKRLSPVIEQARARDVSEADTVTLVKDVLADAFGWDKYNELTSEHAIRGTRCDVAIKSDGKLVMLIEVKAAATDLEERHVKQAIDYAANQGVEWVVLTNAVTWRFYQVIFGKPIDKRMLAEANLLACPPADIVETLFLLTKEGYSKGAHADLRDLKEATNRYLVAALILNDTDVLRVLRRELRRHVDVLVDEEQLLKVLAEEVLKRDVQEGSEAEAAKRRVTRAEARAKKVAEGDVDVTTDSAVASASSADTPPAVGSTPVAATSAPAPAPPSAEGAGVPSA